MDNKIVKLLKKSFLYKYYKRHRDNKLKIELQIRNSYFKKEGEELLRRFSNALNSENIVFWLEFGTLLGYYRDNDFIPHDCDLDVGVRMEDAHRVYGALIKNGFNLVHRYTSTQGGIEECYKYKNTCIDVFYFNFDNVKGTMFCNSFVTRRTLFKKYRKTLSCFVIRTDFPMTEFSNVQFKGADVYIPSETKVHLSASYGKNFMIPDPNYDARSVASNLTFYQYSEVKGILHVYDKKC